MRYSHLPSSTKLRQKGCTQILDLQIIIHKNLHCRCASSASHRAAAYGDTGHGIPPRHRLGEPHTHTAKLATNTIHTHLPLASIIEASRPPERVPGQGHTAQLPQCCTCKGAAHGCV